MTTSVTPLPDARAAFAEAAGRLAAAAIERGDVAEARRALEGALRAIDAAAPALRVLTSGVG